VNRRQKQRENAIAINWSKRILWRNSPPNRRMRTNVVPIPANGKDKMVSFLLVNG